MAKQDVKASLESTPCGAKMVKASLSWATSMTSKLNRVETERRRLDTGAGNGAAARVWGAAGGASDSSTRAEAAEVVTRVKLPVEK